MKKNVIVSIVSDDKFIAWVSTEGTLKIKGFTTKESIEEWIKLHLMITHFNCSFGSFNNCNFELINRIIKAEEIL